MRRYVPDSIEAGAPPLGEQHHRRSIHLKLSADVRFTTKAVHVENYVRGDFERNRSKRIAAPVTWL